MPNAATERSASSRTSTTPSTTDQQLADACVHGESCHKSRPLLGNCSNIVTANDGIGTYTYTYNTSTAHRACRPPSTSASTGLFRAGVRPFRLELVEDVGWDEAGEQVVEGLGVVDPDGPLSGLGGRRRCRSLRRRPG